MVLPDPMFSNLHHLRVEILAQVFQGITLPAAQQVDQEFARLIHFRLQPDGKTDPQWIVCKNTAQVEF